MKNWHCSFRHLGLENRLVLFVVASAEMSAFGVSEAKNKVNEMEKSCVRLNNNLLCFCISLDKISFLQHNIV